MRVAGVIARLVDLDVAVLIPVLDDPLPVAKLGVHELVVVLPRAMTSDDEHAARHVLERVLALLERAPRQDRVVAGRELPAHGRLEVALRVVLAEEPLEEVPRVLAALAATVAQAYAIDLAAQVDVEDGDRLAARMRSRRVKTCSRP